MSVISTSPIHRLPLIPPADTHSPAGSQRNSSRNEGQGPKGHWRTILRLLCHYHSCAYLTGKEVESQLHKQTSEFLQNPASLCFSLVLKCHQTVISKSCPLPPENKVSQTAFSVKIKSYYWGWSVDSLKRHLLKAAKNNIPGFRSTLLSHHHGELPGVW